MATNHLREPDLARPVKGPNERRALVEYVLSTAELQETDYLEWKRVYDLSTRPGAASVAKHLIGFANRSAPQAERHMGGHAYLLVGVEPSLLAGVPHWDAADVENWLSPFVNPELRYDVHAVPLSDKRVLLFDIEPPGDGDPVFALQRASADDRGRALPEGAIYVRRSGKTETHNASDLTRLVARAGTTGPRLRLNVELDADAVTVIQQSLFSDATRDRCLDQRRAELLRGVPTSARLGISSLPAGGEFRSVERYTADVEHYIEAAARKWPAVVASDHVRNARSKLSVALVNETDEHFDAAVLELTLPLPRLAVHLSTAGAALFEPPKAPPPWGSGVRGMIREAEEGIALAAHELEEVADETTLVRFPPTHVRPHTRHRMGALYLAILQAYAGETLDVSWRITARNSRGDLPGSSDFHVPGAPLSPQHASAD